jgi:O-antigen ligase
MPVMATWHPAVPMALRLGSLGILIISAARPAWGLLVIAAVLPLAMPLNVLAAAPFGYAETAELVLAPFLVGAWFRRACAPGSLASRLAWPAVALSALLVTNALVQLVAEQQVEAWPSVFVLHLWRHLSGDYLVDPAPFETVHVTMNWLEALALAVMAEWLLVDTPRLRQSAVRVLLFGAAAAAAFSVNRLAEISLRQVDPIAGAIRFLLTQRLNPHFADLNAAGSYYALFMVASWWIAMRTRRIGAWIVALLTALGLWLTGSRSALAASVLGLGVAWAIDRRPPRRFLVAGLVAIGAVAVLATWNPGRAQVSQKLAMEVRLEMTRIGLQLARGHPAFGVGLGQFKRESAALVTPELARLFPGARFGENAHNNFVQILAESGVFGLAAFMWLLTAPALGFRAAIRKGQSSPNATALAAGLFAFLVTCLAGHPLLIVQVLFPFMMAVGIWSGLLPPQPPPDRRARWRWTALSTLALLGLAVSVPVRLLDIERTRRVDGAVIGASEVLGQLDDEPYRIANDHSRWFTSTDGRLIQIPLRLDADSAVDCQVEVAVDGTGVNVVRPGRGEWLRVHVPMEVGSSVARSRQVDLTVIGSGCRVLVGRVQAR